MGDAGSLPPYARLQIGPNPQQSAAPRATGTPIQFGSFWEPRRGAHFKFRSPGRVLYPALNAILPSRQQKSQFRSSPRSDAERVSFRPATYRHGRPTGAGRGAQQQEGLEVGYSTAPDTIRCGRHDRVDRAGRSIEETSPSFCVFSLELTSRAPAKISYTGFPLRGIHRSRSFPTPSRSFFTATPAPLPAR
jgi:hypothetical protein